VLVANLTFDLGLVEFVQPGAAGLSLTEIIGIAVGVAVALIIIVIIIVVFSVRERILLRQKSREMRRLLAQLSALESSVRDQCKQGSYGRAVLMNPYNNNCNNNNNNKAEFLTWL